MALPTIEEYLETAEHCKRRLRRREIIDDLRSRKDVRISLSSGFIWDSMKIEGPKELIQELYSLLEKE